MINFDYIIGNHCHFLWLVIATKLRHINSTINEDTGRKMTKPIQFHFFMIHLVHQITRL